VSALHEHLPHRRQSLLVPALVAVAIIAGFPAARAQAWLWLVYGIVGAAVAIGALRQDGFKERFEQHLADRIDYSRGAMGMLPKSLHGDAGQLGVGTDGRLLLAPRSTRST
jgi:hypothetical protein